jgi:hypothetical protein
LIQAFELEISQQVHIINCSFAIFEKHEELQPQISAASKQGILVICSTADDGYIRQDVWPAKYHLSNFRNVIPVAACDAKGKLTGYSSKTWAKFRLQGEQIDAADQEASLKVTNAIVSGTSVATAMASGIASLVLACYSILRFCESEPQERENLQVVLNIFDQMCPPDTRDEDPLLLTPGLIFPKKKDHFLDVAHFERWIKGIFAKSEFNLQVVC